MKQVSVWINGLSGKMGQTLERVIREDKRFFLLSGASENNFFEKAPDLEGADLIIDFSSASGAQTLLNFVQEKKIGSKAFLICSTGLSEDLVASWNKLAAKTNVKVMVAPNTSLGVLLTLKAALSVAQVAKEEGFDFILEETHHRYKKDSPSGTALFLGKTVADRVGLTVCFENNSKNPRNTLSIHASRGGGVFGEHTLRLISDHEEITLSHRAFSRDLFAKGALYLGSWLLKQNSGSYNLVDFSIR